MFVRHGESPWAGRRSVGRRRAALHTLLRLYASADWGRSKGRTMPIGWISDFKLTGVCRRTTWACGLKMKECLCSNESTKGLDDFSCSFLHFRTFSYPVQLMALPAVSQENRMPHRSVLPYPPRFEVCGGTGCITSEAVGNGLTSHDLRRYVGPAA